MVLRVDVAAAALDATYGGFPDAPGGRADAQGTPARSAAGRGARGREGADASLGPLRGLRRAHRRAPGDRRGLDRPVRALGRRAGRDGAPRRDRAPPAGSPGSEESGLEESFSAELEGGLEYPHYTRPAEYRGWSVPDVLLSGDHGRIAQWRHEQSRQDPQLRNPVDGSHARLAAPVAHRHRLGGDDPGRGRDRARDQGLRRQSLPDPVLVDGADAALRPARLRLHGAVLRPRARRPVHLPLP